VLTDCGNPKEVEFARRRTFMVKEGSYSIACATFVLGASGSRRRRITSVEALGREGSEAILAIISSRWLTAFFPGCIFWMQALDYDMGKEVRFSLPTSESICGGSTFHARNK
jgi:hypothetical protein